MKKVVSCVLALLLIAALLPAAFAEGTATISISVDGQLLVAAQPISTAGGTVESVLKEAHKQFYSGGESGYAAGIDATYNMFLISKFWGVDGTPYVIVNGAPLGVDPTQPATADACPIAAGDNVIVSISSDMMKPARAVSMGATAEGGSTTVSATEWTLDFTTFQYKDAPLANAKIVDPATGAELGVTGPDGTVSIASCAAAAVEGLAAIPADGSSNAKAVAGAPAAAAPAAAPTGTPGGDATISVSVDGQLVVAAQPVTTTGGTLESVLIEAHKKYFAGGESGFGAGIDPTYNMYLINSFWGVAGTPYVILNGAPLGADPAAPSTADVCPVTGGDNVIVSISSDMNAPARAISMGATAQGGSTTVSATEWTLDFTTFQYKSAPLANARIVDPATGAELGVTGADGTASIASCPVAAIDGLAAIPADGSSNAIVGVGGGAAAPSTPAAPTTSSATGAIKPDGDYITVYVTVSADGALQIAAQPVYVAPGSTIEAALIKAHEFYCPLGSSGYGAGIDPTYNMFLINTFWGIPSTPYVMFNGIPLGSDVKVPSSADTGKVEDGDQLIVNVQSGTAQIPVVALTMNDQGFIVANSWALDFQTFQYEKSTVSNAKLIDAETGTELGTTDGTGKAKLNVQPSCGVIAIEGLSALKVSEGEGKEFACISNAYVPPARDYSLFGGQDGHDLLMILIVGLGMAIPMGIVIFIGLRKELKNNGRLPIDKLP